MALPLLHAGRADYIPGVNQVEDSESAPNVGAAAEVVDRLKDRIRRGDYRPGDRLPSERALSDELGVSRPTVREAIRALATMNVVAQRHGSGIYVRSLDVFDLLEPVRFALELSEPTLASLFEIRLALEPLAARHAATRANSRELQRLASISHEAAQPRVSVTRFLELDAALHETILEASGDDLLRTIISSLSFLSNESRRRTVRRPGVRAMTVQDHTAIAEAIANRDEAGAANAMEQHLRHLVEASGVPLPSST